MPALDEKAYARFNQMLEELESEVPNMQDVPRGFMEDMLEKNKLYGERVFVSPKQLAWIEKLHQEYVGDTDHGQPVKGKPVPDMGDTDHGQPVKGKPVPDMGDTDHGQPVKGKPVPDMDDDIPF